MLRVEFVVAGLRYALRASDVVEVVPRVVLRVLAHAPRGVAGIFTFRGAVTPVVDLSLLLADVPCPERLSSRILVTRIGEAAKQPRLLGLLAEGVTDVTRATLEPQRALSLPHAPYLGDVYSSGEALVQLVEPRALMPRDVWEALVGPEEAQKAPA